MGFLRPTWSANRAPQKRLRASHATGQHGDERRGLGHALSCLLGALGDDALLPDLLLEGVLQPEQRVLAALQPCLRLGLRSVRKGGRNIVTKRSDSPDL